MQFLRHHFLSIGSTNTWSKDNAVELLSKGMVAVSADEQTAGRGRRESHWTSPPGVNLYVSFVLPIEAPEQAWELGLVLALTGCQVLSGKKIIPLIKWPNDLILNGKKLAGILGETTQVKGQWCAIVGFGLNVNITSAALSGVRAPATSLLIESGQLWERTRLLDQLIERFEKNLVLYRENSLETFQKDFENWSIPVGEAITFHQSGKKLEGRIHQYHADGSISICSQDGAISRHHAGQLDLATPSS